MELMCIAALESTLALAQLADHAGSNGPEHCLLDCTAAESQFRYVPQLAFAAAPGLLLAAGHRLFCARRAAAAPPQEHSARDAASSSVACSSPMECQQVGRGRLSRFRCSDAPISRVPTTGRQRASQSESILRQRPTVQNSRADVDVAWRAPVAGGSSCVADTSGKSDSEKAEVGPRFQGQGPPVLKKPDRAARRRQLMTQVIEFCTLNFDDAEPTERCGLTCRMLAILRLLRRPVFHWESLQRIEELVFRIIGLTEEEMSVLDCNITAAEELIEEHDWRQAYEKLCASRQYFGASVAFDNAAREECQSPRSCSWHEAAPAKSPRACLPSTETLGETPERTRPLSPAATERSVVEACDVAVACHAVPTEEFGPTIAPKDIHCASSAASSAELLAVGSTCSDADTVEVDSSFEVCGLPSLGSALHHVRQCKPCAFLHHPKGCDSGRDCTFCHLCDVGEKKRRAKDKRASHRTNTHVGN